MARHSDRYIKTDLTKRGTPITSEELDQPGFDTIQEFVDDNTKWSIETFGRQGVFAPLEHLKAEVDEVIESFGSMQPEHIDTEFADCFILLMQAASNYGLTFQEMFKAAQAKMIVNKSRKWQKPDEQGRCFHVK